MAFYRLKHIPTGLYFCPCRKILATYEHEGQFYRQRVKSNLSKKGRAYPSRPSLKWIGEDFRTHLELERRQPVGSGWFRFDSRLRRLDPAEWEIEENK